MSAQKHVFYLSHGGEPMPLMGDPEHTEMVSTLKKVANEVGRPSAILLISAHWETTVPCITASALPELIYDYSGFSKEASDIEYRCPGEPTLAAAIKDAQLKAGINAELDTKRGLDHGAFVPLKIMYPEANIPCVQLSLKKGLDADFHVQIGHILSTLDYDNLLIIGSGMSFHNMSAFFIPKQDEKAAIANAKNWEFERWLVSTITDASLDESQRRQQLVDWETAPSARFCHPCSEHLIPLHVCYGVTERSSNEYYPAQIIGKQTSMFYWRI